MTPLELDYRANLQRLFDTPASVAASDSMLVIGDALEASGDPRGQLIALAEGIAREPGAGRSRALSARLAEHVVAQGSDLLGGLASYSWMRRGFHPCWRGGHVYSARLDLRHVSRLAGIEPRAYLELALAAPCMEHVRRVSVRVEDTARLVPIFLEAGDDRPLEEIIIGPELPLTGLRFRHRLPHLDLGPLDRDSSTTFLARHPRLWLVALGGVAREMPIFAGSWERDDALVIDQIEALCVDSPATRTSIGRALWSRPEPRRAALRAMARTGSVAAFARSIEIMFHTRAVPDQAKLAEAIGALGAAALPLAPALRRATGHPSRLRVETRRAVGRALAAIA